MVQGGSYQLSVPLGPITLTEGVQSPAELTHFLPHPGAGRPRLGIRIRGLGTAQACPRPRHLVESLPRPGH